METTMDKIKVHKETFENDPVFKNISSRGLEDFIFSDEEYFNKIAFTDTYSTKRAAGILNESNKEYKLTNLLSRDALKDYFQVFRKNDKSHYRYTWESIFRFKMVLTLMDQANLTPSDIDDIVNDPILIREETIKPYQNKPAYNNPNGNSLSNQPSHNFKKELQEANRFVLASNQHATLHAQLLDRKSDLKRIESEIRNVERHIRYLNIQDLKEVAENVTKTKNVGFWSRIFGGQGSEGNNETEEYQTAAREELTSLENQKKELIKDKEIAESEIVELENKFDSINNEFYQQSSKLFIEFNENHTENKFDEESEVKPNESL